VERFWEDLGAFLHTARADVPEGLPLRRTDLDDGVLPAGGTAAALARLELGAMAGDRQLYGIGERAARVARRASWSSRWLSPRRARSPRWRESRVVIAGDANDPRTLALWEYDHQEVTHGRARSTPGV
jgi:hypothetical protein